MLINTIKIMINIIEIIKIDDSCDERDHDSDEHNNNIHYRVLL
jgi:hypothetical protein